ncbi:MAG: hypothetical protein U9P82_00845, partial [Bacteroidota bacterium]|nr:hypothetical protein [Bacteroidota bacterium]
MDTLIGTSGRISIVTNKKPGRMKKAFRWKSLSFMAMLFLTLGLQNTFGQGVGISESSITPDPSSILELRSTERGFLIPRMTEGERDAIATPATGLIVYNTSTDKLNIYDGTTWRVLFSGNVGINDIYGTTDRITIDKSNPANPIINIASTYGGQTSIDTLGTITTGTWNATTIEVPYGGTGLTSITTNNLLYGNGTNAVSLLAPSTTTGALLTESATGAPAWLTLDVLPATAGILNTVNGGTGYDSYTDGQLLIGNTVTDSLSRSTLTGTTNQINITNGNGNITLSTPQDIHTGASPEFVGLTLSGLAADQGVYTTTGGFLTTTPPASGTLGYWGRTGTTLSPATNGDDITTTGAIYTTGTGTITSAGLLTAQDGLNVTNTLQADDNVILGATNADTLTVNATADFKDVLNVDGAVT